MFVPASDITIGKFRFSGAHEVRIKHSLHSIVNTATIIIPAVAKIVKDGKMNPDGIITGKQFNDGDQVTIRLGYNNNLQTEFKGFVIRRNLNMPLEVECEGYSWLLRRNTVTKFWKSISVKDLLKEAISGINSDYKIGINCDVDFELNNVNANSSNGFEIIENISKFTDGCLSCFFIQPDLLWCGLLYTPYADSQDRLNQGSVNYRLGYNVVEDNSLKERVMETDPVKVIYSKKLANGNLISQNSDVFKKFLSIRNKILNQITDAAALKMLANEKAYKLNYSGYEGYLNAFLEPYAVPGYLAYIEDNRYPERNGKYVVESTEVQFGIHGARRIIELGPKAGFANSI